MSESVSDDSLVPNSESESDSKSYVPLGTLFKQKREEHGWTSEDAAKSLRLSVQKIEALENDEYDKLPSTTYIIGYWRSYAHLLELDISESIEFHKSNLTSSPSAIALNPGQRQEISGNQSGLIFLVLSVVLLSAIWYWQSPDNDFVGQWVDQQLDQADRKLLQDSTNESNQIGLASRDATTLIPNQSDSLILPVPNFSDDTKNTAVDKSATVTIVSEDADSLPLGSSDASTQAGSDEYSDTDAISPTPPPIQPQQVEETSVMSTQPIDRANEPLPTPSPELADDIEAEMPVIDSPNWIFFSVEKRGWLDVRDVSGEKLIYRIVNTGESIALRGQPPFYVFVGVVDGVNIEYLNKPVHFEADADSIFARFRVGRAVNTNQ